MEDFASDAKYAEFPDGLGLFWSESADALHLAIELARPRKMRVGFAKESKRVYFCELCDRLTQSSSSQRGTPRFCAMHVPGELGSWYDRDHRKSRRFHQLRRMILAEAHRAPEYRQRFLSNEETDSCNLLAHLDSCKFCNGYDDLCAPDHVCSCDRRCSACAGELDHLEPECLDPSEKYFTALMAFHANVRKVAYALTTSSHRHDGLAVLIDEAVQEGTSAKDIGAEVGLGTKKKIGQHSELAFQRLFKQRRKDSEIAGLLAISIRQVLQRKPGQAKSSSRGWFDFAATRDSELRWWPYSDTGWRHSEHEYRHLIGTRQRR